jgi:hypothetical protein
MRTLSLILIGLVLAGCLHPRYINRDTPQSRIDSLNQEIADLSGVAGLVNGDTLKFRHCLVSPVETAFILRDGSEQRVSDSLLRGVTLRDPGRGAVVGLKRGGISGAVVGAICGGLFGNALARMPEPMSAPTIDRSSLDGSETRDHEVARAILYGALVGAAVGGLCGGTLGMLMGADGGYIISIHYHFRQR